MSRWTPHYHWGQFQTHAFHVVSSMDPVVLATLSLDYMHSYSYMVGKTYPRKAYQSAKPGNATV